MQHLLGGNGFGNDLAAPADRAVRRQREILIRALRSLDSFFADRLRQRLVRSRAHSLGINAFCRWIGLEPETGQLAYMMAFYQHVTG